MANEFGVRWKNENSASYELNADNLHAVHPSYDSLEQPFIVQHSQTQLKIKANTAIKIVNESTHKVFRVTTDTIIAVASNLDTGVIQAGKDYYVYLCDGGGDSASIVISLNSTYPAGYNANNSRKIGGFHTLCAAVGTISNHPLSGYSSAAILPQSVWDLSHRPKCSPEGMVWSPEAGIWVDIYLQSGTGATTASANGGTITDNRNWMDFVDDLGAVGKQLLSDEEFQLIAAGSNEETNIVGSADPVTTGGHSDTADRRMISNIGCEGCCGVMWQWLRTQSYRMDGVDLAASQAWRWEDLPGAKGSAYLQGTYGDAKLLAGGAWGRGADCGPRGRNASSYRWDASSYIGGRGRAKPR